MKNNTPIAFNFNNLAVRIIPNVEQPLFVAKDVAVALGYEKPNDAISRHCKGIKNSLGDDSVKRGVISDRLGREQQVILIDEPDVYRLIFGSKLESAEKFQNWVFEEVLPSIRKTGSYRANQSNPIRLHETRVKLLKELHKADTQPMRESIYQSLQAVSQELGLPLLPMEDFQTTHDKEALKVCNRFWATVELIHDEAETPVNHSNNPNQIAVNLPEIIKLADKHDIDCPSTTELRRYLRSSGNPRFNGIRAVRSCLINEPKKCWVFEV